MKTKMPASIKCKPESGYSSRASSESANTKGTSIIARIKQTSLFDFFVNNDEKSKKSAYDENKTLINERRHAKSMESSATTDENEENTDKNRQVNTSPRKNSTKLDKSCGAGKLKEPFDRRRSGRLSICAKTLNSIELERENVNKTPRPKGNESNKKVDRDEASILPQKVSDGNKVDCNRRRSRRQSICVDKFYNEKQELKKFSYKKNADESVLTKVSLPDENRKSGQVKEQTQRGRRRKSICIGSLCSDGNGRNEIFDNNNLQTAPTQQRKRGRKKKCLIEKPSAKVEPELLVKVESKLSETIQIVHQEPTNEEFFEKENHVDVIDTFECFKDLSECVDPMSSMLIRFGLKDSAEQERALKALKQVPDEPADHEVPNSKRPREESHDDAKQSAKRLKINETEFEEVESVSKDDPGIIEEIIEDIWYVSVKAIEKDYVVRFLVKWDGFAPSENTLEPYEHVADTFVVQEYVRRKFEMHQDKIDAAVEKLSSEAKIMNEKYHGKSKKFIMKRLKQFDVLHFRCNVLAYIYTYDKIPNFCLFMKHLRSQCVIYKQFIKFEREQEVNKFFLTKIMKKEKNLFKVTAENKLDFDPVPHFDYIRSVDFPKIEKTRLGCSCEGSCSGSTTCCPSFLNLKQVYDVDSRLCASSHQMIVECTNLCHCDDLCPNRPKRTKFNLCVFKTANRGWALKTLDHIPAATFVIEYTGELINMTEAKKRTREYKKLGVTYLFDLDYNEKNVATHSLDATHKGNLSRFINHSCNANLQTWPATSCNESLETHRLYYFSLRPIRAGEELTVDYSGGVIRPDMSPPKDATPCKCNSDNCRGFIF
jgi:hypothetical protein